MIERIVVPPEEAVLMSPEDKFAFVLDMYGLKRRDELERKSQKDEEWAELGLKDLFFMTVVILGYGRATLTGLHYDMCSFIEDGAEQSRQGIEWHGLVEVPREHFKTTFCVIGRGLQRIAEDPDKCQLITSATDTLAKATSAAMRWHIEHNGIYQRLYPYVVPDRNQFTGGAWRVQSRKRVRTPRREPTVMTIGVGGTGESFHFDWISQDDLVTRVNSESRTMQEGVKAFYQANQALLNEGGEEITTGTRFCDYDLYGWMRSDKSQTGVNLFHRKVEQEEELEDGSKKTYFIFPEEWDDVRLNEKRTKMSLSTFYCQYFNNPMPDELVKFDSDFFKYYSKLPDDTCFVIGWDPSTGLGADNSAMVVVAYDDVGNFYVHEIMDGLWTEDKQIVMADTLNQKYHPILTMTETYGYQKSILSAVDVFQEEQAEDRGWDSYWMLEGEGGDKRSKPNRILTMLQPLYARGKISHHKDIKGSELEYQLNRFGVASDDHLADALYYAVLAATRSGYVGPADQPKPPPVTPHDKLMAGVELSADERITIGPTTETDAAYDRRSPERIW